MARTDARRIDFFDDADDAAPQPDPAPVDGPPPAPAPRRRRRRVIAGVAAVAVLGAVAGAVAWQQRRDTDTLRDQAGAVLALSSAPVAKATVDIDPAALVWLGEDLMASRDGALVGLDPATGSERWRIADLGDAQCTPDAGASSYYGEVSRLDQVDCVSETAGRLVTVKAGGTIARDVTFSPADAFALAPDRVVQARWDADSVQVTGTDLDGEEQWTTQLPRNEDQEGCVQYTYQPGSNSPEAVHDERALSVYVMNDVAYVSGCGVSAQLDTHGEITHAPPADVNHYTRSGTTVRVTNALTVSESRSEILDAAGSPKATMPGVVMLPSATDGRVGGWYVRRVEGLTRVDEQGADLWVAPRLPRSVVAALTDTTILADQSGLWGLDTATGADLWEADLSELTASWREDNPGAYGVATAFTDGSVVALALTNLPTDADPMSGLVALDAATGKVRWQLPPDGTTAWFGAAAGHLVGLRMGEDSAQLVFYG